MRLVWVAVPVPALDLLTYRVPEGIDPPVVGARVLVPLGTREITGCVVRTDLEAGEQPGDGRSTAALRDVIAVLDAEPFLPGPVIDIVLWVAEYYLCGAGEALAAAMPPFAWVRSQRLAEITELGRQRVEETGNPPGGLTGAVLGALGRGRPMSPSGLVLSLRRGGQVVGSAAELAGVIRTLERNGLVHMVSTRRGEAQAFKTVRIATLTPLGRRALQVLDQSAIGHDGHERDEDRLAGQADGGDAGRERPMSTGRKQREALAGLRGFPDGLPLAVLGGRGVTVDSLRRLAARGLVTIGSRRVERDPFRVEGTVGTEAAGGAAVPGNSPPESCAPSRTLTDEQTAALQRLADLAATRTFKVALVYGVTGSGKTEVYLRLAHEVCASGRHVLVMVPEIALTPVVTGLFRQSFGDRVAIQHSGLSDGERHDQWQRIRHGQVDVVVGTRSAVFVPIQSLGLIIVDEEHDTSYKQEESPRYHGRDVAIMRAKQEGALVVLGSATPALETYQNALSERYELATLERRVLDRPLASVRIVNMREEFAARGPDVVFSEVLRTAVADRLARRDQVLILLNRRGYATAVLCRQCGDTIDCPNCSVSLTVHWTRGRPGDARCHYCNYSTVVPKTCPRCGAPYLVQTGFGTERIETEAAAFFPDARIARLDRDIVQRRGAAAALLARFARGEIDVLIGTQMIAKGHDFPRITLVGVISADVGLGLPDFRAAERTFQLLTQVVGRAGRGEILGEAIIQTLYPEHYSVRLACRQDYAAFFDEEIRFRRAMRYPPVVALINGVVRGPTLGTAMDDASDLVGRLRNMPGHGSLFQVLGPAPAPLVKLRGEHRVQFLVKGTRRTEMRQALQDVLAKRPDLRRRVTVDVDPLSVM